MRMLQADIGVLHPWLYCALERGAEKGAESEVFAPNTGFVIQARLVRCHDAAACCGEVSNLRTLSVRQSSDVRKNQRLEPARGIKLPVVYHLEGDPRFDERLVDTVDVVFYP